MINFKEFITEARMAPLYHGTRSWNAPRIIESNELRANPTHGGDTPHHRGSQPDVISLTRNLKTALHWGSGVVFELDQQKLSQRYKIRPIEIEYVWHNKGKYGTNPKDPYEPKASKLYEEYVVGTIKPLDRYLVRIIITNDFMRLNTSPLRGTVPIELQPVFNHPLLYNIDTKQWVNK